MNNNHPPNPVQYIQCAALIARVMISGDGKFTRSEIELASELLECSWNNNVTDFLHVIAGTAQPAPLPRCPAGFAPAGLRTDGTKPSGWLRASGIAHGRHEAARLVKISMKKAWQLLPSSSKNPSGCRARAGTARCCPCFRFSRRAAPSTVISCPG